MLNSFQFMHQTVHAGFLWAEARTTVGTFSILCRWCILYYNGTTLNCWNHWLVCLRVQPPELTRWKRFTCSSDKLSFRAHDRNIRLDVQTGCGGFDSYKVRMVERDVLGWWRTAWYDFLWPRCVLRHFSAEPNRHKLLAKEELDPDYQLKESKRNVLMSNVINLHGYRLQRCSEVCESNSVWSKRCFKVIKGWTTKLPVCSIRG